MIKIVESCELLPQKARADKKSKQPSKKDKPSATRALTGYEYEQARPGTALRTTGLLHRAYGTAACGGAKYRLRPLRPGTGLRGPTATAISHHHQLLRASQLAGAPGSGPPIS